LLTGALQFSCGGSGFSVVGT